MPPILALLIWFVLLVALLRRDPAKDPTASGALWIPLTWMIVTGSRLPAQWLGMTGVSALGSYEEGNLLDRSTHVVLIVSALYILLKRSVRWNDIITRNFALALFVLYTLLSIVWSDFPFVASKRWVRDFGNYLMVLVILTDPRPLDAMQTVLRRLFYCLIPLSVVLIKYFPHWGRGYSEWTGDAFYLGVTTSKNMLGLLCLVSVIFFFWDSVRRWPDRKERRTRRILFVNVAFFAMTLWLLRLANSATSLLCALVGCAIIAAAHTRTVRANPNRLKILLPSALGLFLVLDFSFDIIRTIVEALGRETTLTGRTALWTDVLGIGTNPLLGAGYETFWLGDRLTLLWAKHPFGPNQAHNGYLEIYLNLGMLGLLLLGAFFVSAYRSICNRLTNAMSFTSLSLALWVVILLYAVTEAAFKSHLLWLTFLLGAMATSLPVERARAVRAERRPVRIRESVAR